MNKTLCKDCLELKVRIKSDRRKSVNRFHYIDDNGRLWNGHQCPQCKVPKASGHEAQASQNIREDHYNWIEDPQQNGYDNCRVDDDYIYC